MPSNTDVLSITTPLPDASFVVTGLNGTERLSRPFQYTVLLGSGSALLDPNSLLDKPVTVSLGDPTGLGRYVNGIVSNVTQLPYASTTLWQYQLTVVPKLQFLAQTKDCRFYHSQTVPAIVESIFSDFNITYNSTLQGSYTTRDYTVQFNETYLDFVQRLLENEGIFYFFTHTDSAHTLVLGDQKTAFTAINNPQLYLSDSATTIGGLTGLQRGDSTALGVITLDDYDPATDTLTTAGSAIRGTETTVLEATGAPQRTFYTWPAVQPTTSDATSAAKWQMLAAEGAAQLYSGTGGAPDFFAGGKFTVNNDPLGIGNYVIQAVSYTVDDSSTAATTAGGSIAMQFTAFPATVDWREVPSVAPPVMAGLYTGIVIGPSGEEIYIDDLGRIQVWFPWDTRSEIKAASTFWARVVQPWAGVGWGTQFIPRVGMEVAVAFLEGDVNRPVVVGSMYNGNNTPVYSTSDKNKSGIRTRSTTGGGTSNFNEFSFDDTMGSELFYLHAEKDYTLEVENDRTVTVTKDESVTISGKQTIAVTGNQSVTVDQGNQSITLNSGNISVTVSTGSVSYTAQQSMSFTVGGSSISIGPSGITISAPQITLSGETSVGISGAAIQVTADGDLTLAGAMTSIG